MDHVTPAFQQFRFPEGTRAIEVAADQPQFSTMTVFRTPDGRVVSQWKPTDEELLWLLNGTPVTLVLFTGGGRQQPVQLFVGGADLRDEPTCPRCERALSSDTMHTRLYCAFMAHGRWVRVYDTYCERSL
jgi:hypothetical protein